MAAAARSPTCNSRVTASRCSTSCCRSKKGRELPAVFVPGQDGVTTRPSASSLPKAAFFYCRPAYRNLLVPIYALAALVPLLRFHRQRGDRPGLKPLERDRLAGLLTIAVGTIVDPLQRRIDLGDQLALAIPRPQFDRSVGFRRRAIGEIGMVLVFVLKMLQRFPGFLEDFLLPGEQFVAEMLPLPLVHERLFIRWPIVSVFLCGDLHSGCSVHFDFSVFFPRRVPPRGHAYIARRKTGQSLNSGLAAARETGQTA